MHLGGLQRLLRVRPVGAAPHTAASDATEGAAPHTAASDATTAHTAASDATTAVAPNGVQAVL